MVVFAGSRYAGCSYIGIVGTDGKTRKFLTPRKPLTLADVPAPVLVQPFQEGQVIDELAWIAAGKPRLWWVIADVSDILFALDIPPGTNLSIPTQELLNRPEI